MTLTFLQTPFQKCIVFLFLILNPHQYKNNFNLVSAFCHNPNPNQNHNYIVPKNVGLLQLHLHRSMNSRRADISNSNNNNRRHSCNSCPFSSSYAATTCNTRKHRGIALTSHKNNANSHNDATHPKDGNANANWEAKKENIKEDFDKLRIAYIKNNACTDMQEKERLFLLDSISKSKEREVVRDLAFGVCGVCSYMLVLFGIRRVMMLNHAGANRMLLLGRLACRKMLDLNYWMFVIAAPLLYYLYESTQIIKNNRKQAQPHQEAEAPSPSLQAKESCKNYIQCLTENWISSILGYASIRACFSHPLLKLHPPRHNLLLLLIIRCINRIGAMTSLHQYPKLNYELYDYNLQFRNPVTCRIALFQSCRRALSFSFCSGFIGDFTSILLLGPSILSSSSTAVRPYAGAVWSTRKNVLIGLLQSVGILIAILPPIMHILSFTRLLQIQTGPNISLGTASYQQAQDLSSTTTHKLRWRFKWRQPERIQNTLKHWYRFIVTGYVNSDPSSRKRGDSIFDSPTLTRTINGNKEGTLNSILEDTHLPLLRLLASETPSPSAQTCTHTQSVQNAMDQMIRTHKESLEDKSFDDPLGIAVQQIFNIGLSFDYDHTTPLLPNETPSLYRLRARAAKTAIKYIQHLKNNPEYEADIVNNPDFTPSTRVRLMEEYETRVDLEVSYYRNQLLTLFPTNMLTFPDGISDEDMDLIVSKSTTTSGRGSTNTIEAVLGDMPTFRDDFLQKEYGDDRTVTSKKSREEWYEYDIVNRFQKGNAGGGSEWDYVYGEGEVNCDNVQMEKSNDDCLDDVENSTAIATDNEYYFA